MLLLHLCQQPSTEELPKVAGEIPANKGKKMPKAAKSKQTKYQKKIKSVMGEFKSGSLHSGKRRASS